MFKSKLKYAFYTLTHPFDGFYEIRWFNKGSLFWSLTFLFLASLSYSLNKQYASFIVNDTNPLNINSLIDLAVIIFLFLMFCVGNWSITTLMEGEGRFQDIVTVTGYSIIPIILFFNPATIFSHFIAANEEAFYYMLIAIAVVWTLILIFISNMIVHGYSFSKALTAMLLTIVAMVIILFLVILLVSLVQQVYSFFNSLYMELIFRS